jgi:hypothetical protein
VSEHIRFVTEGNERTCKVCGLSCWTFERAWHFMYCWQGKELPDDVRRKLAS